MKVQSKLKKINNFSKGYIALMSVIVISIMLLAMTFAVSNNEFFLRYDELNSEFKRISLGLAEGCVNFSFLRIAQDYNYTPLPTGDNIIVGGGTCTIKSVIYGPEDMSTHQKIATIKIQAQYKGVWTDLDIGVTVSNPAFAPLYSYLPDVTINSWVEMPTSD